MTRFARTTALLFLTALALSHTTPADAQRVHAVPTHYATVQSALDEAAPGDVVVVWPGTYAENIVWPDTPGIKLVSTAGPDSTILTGSSRGSVIRIVGGTEPIDANTVIQGFSIVEGGGVDFGGGLYVRNASPMLLDLVVAGNTAYREGGGIYLTDRADVIIRNLVLRQNTAPDGGGGLRSRGSKAVLINAVVSENTSVRGKGPNVSTEGGPVQSINFVSLE